MLLDRLKDEEIPLTVCPLSNLKLCVFRDVDEMMTCYKKLYEKEILFEEIFNIRIRSYFQALTLRKMQIELGGQRAILQQAVYPIEVHEIDDTPKLRVVQKPVPIGT